jgi:CRP/FNR family transcriptional regulator
MYDSTNPCCAECTNDNKLFSGLPLECKKLFTQNKGKNIYKKGQVIYYEGNYPNGLFCIHSGKVKISKIGKEGKEQIVKFAEKGVTLGYRALMNDEPYNATATAMEDCHICHLSKNTFMTTLESNNKLSLNMIQLLSNDLKNSERKLINLSQKPVKDRVAEALLVLQKHFGFKEDGKTIDATLTRREIGELAGITTETAIRTLSEFNRKKIIKLDGKKIIIQDMDNLQRVSNTNFEY